jgi:hypothetical protein
MKKPALPKLYWRHCKLPNVASPIIRSPKLLFAVALQLLLEQALGKSDPVSLTTHEKYVGAALQGQQQRGLALSERGLGQYSPQEVAR